MGRALGILSLVAATVIAGLLLSAQSSHSTSSASASADVAKAQLTANEVKLQQAELSVEQFHALHGTYVGAGGGGVRLVAVEASSYCLEAGGGASVAHLAGPGGTPAAGPCQ
jgi:hypothetical protein